MPKKPNNKIFRLLVILSKKGVTIIPQGQITISYLQLIAGILSVILFLSTGMPMLSQFIPSDFLEILPTSVKNDDRKDENSTKKKVGNAHPTGLIVVTHFSVVNGG
ncbi:hypothetical protein [Crocosphaera chwakensis]|uniref:hypothetical protein n=1 Tax=Crocosphaera chwakensis TaxID=2546361 RepID=UPI00055D549D|nr:hypothetical protein [Crocosphaera chwakensis]